MPQITLKQVIQDKNFYRLETGIFGGQKFGEEADRLEYAVYLLRCELFRLRLVELGVRDTWISQRKPDFVQQYYHPRTPREIIHSNLRQQVEYLRADAIVAAARMRRRIRKLGRK